MKFLTKYKKKIMMFLIMVTLIFCTALTVSAEVKVDDGIQNIVTPLKSQVMSVAAIIFALMAIVAIAIALFKLVSSLLENHRTNEPINWKPIGLAFAAAVVCGLCSSTLFFSWFGIGG